MFPACAGVILLVGFALIGAGSVPRMRGGDPRVKAFLKDEGVCSPHARG